MQRKTRTILVACVTALLCVAMIAGGTYALFTDQVTMTNHLQAGTMDITLLRTNLTTKTLNSATGFLISNEYADDEDFSDPTNKNLFEIDSADMIAPGCEYNAEMQIFNNSDVAFAYWLEVVFVGTEKPELANQLRVTVTTASGTPIEAYLKDGLTVGNETNAIATLAKGAAQIFYVKVDFVDDKTAGVTFDNNNAMDNVLQFDVIVHAVQVTQAPIA